MNKIALGKNLLGQSSTLNSGIKTTIIVDIISAFFVVLFVYAAVSKFLDYSTFQIQLSKSPLLTQFSSFIPWALPFGEVIVSLILVFGRTRMIGLYASLFIMTMFTAYIYIMLNFSYDIPCSCGGLLSMMSWEEHFWFNLIFVVFGIVGILLNAYKTETSSAKVVNR